MSTQKIPPFDINAETGVIASILMEPSLMDEAIRQRLETSSFFQPRHQIIFAAMEELFKKGEHIDTRTVADVLQKNDCLFKVDGFAGINAIVSQIDTTAGFTNWAKIVKSLDLKRQIIQNAKAIEEDTFNSADEPSKLIERCLERIFSVQQRLSTNESLKTTEVIDWRGVPPERSAIKTPIPTLNHNLNGGYRPTELNILAARPATGKTTLAIQIALEALKNGRRVVFVSLEMSMYDIRNKMLSSLTGRNVEWVKEKLTDDFQSIAKYIEWIEKSKFGIRTSIGINVAQFKASIEQSHLRDRIDLLVIDYLQLMPTTSKGNRNDQVAEISRTLKLMAMELDISILALSQLSRDGDKAGREPVLSDLRDSGSLEQDANSVLFIHKKDDESFILKLAKNRMGECGAFKVNADFCNNRFLEIDSRAQEPAGYVKPQPQVKPQPVLPYHLQREEKPAF